MEATGVTLRRVAASSIVATLILRLVFAIASALIAAHVAVVLVATAVTLVSLLHVARVVTLRALATAHVDGLLRTNVLIVAWRVLGTATVTV